MPAIKILENKLEEIFQGTPQLSEKNKKTLVNVWPWLALFFGILQLAAAWTLWALSNTADRILDGVNQFSLYYTGKSADFSSSEKVWMYLGIIILVLDAIILLMAYPHLVKRAKKGWELLFLGSVINLVYSVFNIFISGRGIGGFFTGLIGSVIVFYLLFQVKSKFNHKSTTE